MQTSFTRQRDRRHLARLAPIIIAIGVLATACSQASSGPVVAGDGFATASTSASSQTSMVAFAQCMRSHGLPDFPDPSSNGGIKVNGSQGGALDPNSAQYQTAFAACKSLMPRGNGGGKRPARAQMLKYAQCMRAHGVTDFPDPNADGGLNLGGSGDLDPSSPLFQQADSKCKQNLPGGPTRTGATR